MANPGRSSESHVAYILTISLRERLRIRPRLCRADTLLPPFTSLVQWGGCSMSLQTKIKSSIYGVTWDDVRKLLHYQRCFMPLVALLMHDTNVGVGNGYYSAFTTNASEFKKSFSWNNIRRRMIATARGVRGKWRRHNKCPVLLDNWQALLNYSRRELQVLFSSNRSILRAWAQILERPAFARVLNLMRQHSEISARLDSFMLLELDTGLESTTSIPGFQ